MNALSVIQRSPVVSALAGLAAMAMLFISEGTYRESVATLDHLGTSQVGRVSLRDLRLGVVGAESSQRGYLLTARKAYLEPYAHGVQEANDSLAELTRYYGDQPAAAQPLAELRTTVQARLAELAHAIQLHDQGRRDEGVTLALSDIGHHHMQAVRAQGAALLQIELAELARRRTELYATLTLSRVAVAALSAIGLLALFLYLRQNAIIERYRLELVAVAKGERTGLELEIEQRTAQLTELTRHLLTAREDERNRLARNLHDELGALLTSAKLDAARIKSRLANSAPEAQERLAHLVETLNSSIALGRSIIEDLRPSTLANLGLVPTLEILLREFAEHSGVKVHAALQEVKLSAGAELAVYRLAQEALTNLSKYAKAGQVWVRMQARDGHVEVSVRDDGVGFDAGAPRRSTFGLLGMRFRVEAVGGRMTVVSAPGQGTELRVRLPESA